MRAKVLMLQLISIQNQNVLASQVYTKYRSLSSSHCAPYLNTKTSICLQANQSQTTKPQKVSFDSDSFEILVDNGASRSITNNKKDFIDTPRLARTLIEGYSGTSEASLIGTVKWTIADDQGLEHNIILPNTILDKKAKMRILSPQHWSQTVNDHYPKRYGALCATLDDQILLMWKQRLYVRSIPLEPNKANVGIMSSAPRTNYYCKSCIILENSMDKVIALPTIFESTDP